MTDEQEQRVTSGSDWRKPREEGFIKTLPSGKSARLRPVDMGVLLASGEVPNLLTPLAVGRIMGEEELEEPVDENEALREHTTEMVELMNLVCKASFLEPRIVEEPTEDNEISIEDLEFSDRSFVWSLATQGAEMLRKFRLGEVPGVDDVSDSGDDGAEAEPVTEPE